MLYIHHTKNCLTIHPGNTHIFIFIISKKKNYMYSLSIHNNPNFWPTCTESVTMLQLFGKLLFSHITGAIIVPHFSWGTACTKTPPLHHVKVSYHPVLCFYYIYYLTLLRIWKPDRQAGKAVSVTHRNTDFNIWYNNIWYNNCRYIVGLGSTCLMFADLSCARGIYKCQTFRSTLASVTPLRGRPSCWRHATT